MEILRSKVICLALLVFFPGCSASSFRLIKQDGRAVEFRVTPDRVLLECEHQYDNDDKTAYGFLMYVLDEGNAVITVAQSNTLDKGSCFRRVEKIGRILRVGKIIYIGGVGDLTEPKVEEERKLVFPGMGTFQDTGRTLQFMVIANEKGLCYDAYSGDEAPCPREPFSLKGLE